MGPLPLPSSPRRLLALLTAAALLTNDGVPHLAHGEVTGEGAQQSQQSPAVAGEGAGAGGGGVCRKKDKSHPSCAAAAEEGDYRAQEAARRLMPHPPGAHRRDLPFAPPLPRLSEAELQEPGNEAYRDRRRPFILTDGMADWPALQRWKTKGKRGKFDPFSSYLGNMFSSDVVDFYPYNMLEPGTHPYLWRFRSALGEMMNPPGSFPSKGPNGDAGNSAPWACAKGCRYVHLQLSPAMWDRLEEAGDIPRDRHALTRGDNWWQSRCLKDPAVLAEYYLKTHWKIILTGTKGSGMFNHSDSLLTSSWHGHIEGKKWWYVCGRNQNEETGAAGGGRHECFESILYPGEILYYGKHWAHATRNLKSPTTTITGTVVHRHNFRDVADRLFAECARSELSFDFSGQLCDALTECYPLWHAAWGAEDEGGGGGGGGGGLPLEESTYGRHDWRWYNTPKQQREKDRIKPTENNYDGRNYIGGN